MAKAKNVQPLVAVPQGPEVPAKAQNITIEIYNDERGTYDFLEYMNIVGHQVGQQWVAVITSEDETLVFRSVDVKTIRVWKE